MPLQRRNPNEYNYDQQNSYRPNPGAPSSASEVSPIDEGSPYSFPVTAGRSHPAAHPQSSYNAMRQQRFSGGDYFPSSSPPPPPAHSQSNHPHVPHAESAVTAGADNLGAAAVGGGIAGVARGVAHGNEPYAGHSIPRGYQDDSESMSYQGAAGYPNNGAGYGNPYGQSSHDQGPGYFNPGYGNSHYAPSDRGLPVDHDQPPGQRGPGFYDGPYQRNSAALGGLNSETINPNDIVDDGDDGLLAPNRRSVLSLGKNSSHNSLAAGAGAGAAGGGVLGAVAGRVGGQTHSGSDDGPSYSAVPTEKAELASYEKSRKKKAKWIIIIVGVLVLAGAIAGGVAGGIISTRNKSTSSSSGGGSADDDEKENGDLNKDSEEIKKLMDNSDFHKVFPGIDYTPWGTQYPLCKKWPPSQNNVTRDMAVLSQLTNVVRLYGTDCNQTEMVIHAIDRLKLEDMKLWMGVWIDTNQTTNNRQLDLMEKILKKQKKASNLSVFKGVIVGNEYLFRGHQSQSALTALGDYISGVKKTLKDLEIDLPVATSDLGDAWTAGLAKISDAVMSNVHPFFGGVPVEEAAGWTWTFWNGHNVPLTEGSDKDNLISEVGWPTGGGNSCGDKKCSSSSSGSVAGVKQLNQFMDDWVCQSLKNGTDYFWYVAFLQLVPLLCLFFFPFLVAPSLIFFFCPTQPS